MKNKKKNIRELDPFLEREREQYEHPLPSREYILQILAEQGVPVDEEELCSLLQIEPHEEELFTRRLRAMERDGQIMRNRKRRHLRGGQARSDQGQGAGSSGWFRLSDSRRRQRRSGAERQGNAQGAARRHRDGAGGRRGPARHGAKRSIVEVLEHGNDASGRALVRGAWHPVRGGGESPHQPGHPGCARRTQAAQRQGRW